MQIIKKLSDQINDELDDSKHYAKCALKHKDDNRGLADVYYNLSVDEMRHANMLHEEVAKVIDQYRRENGDPPEGMQAVYDYLHEKQIEKAGEVKAMQALYKGA